MKQYEAVVEAMRRNGGFSTLGHLYQVVPSMRDCVWGTKTPFASIRRIVQVHPQLFFKVEPGLWALNESKDEVLSKLGLAPGEPQARREEFGHSYYQGLLIQVGNLRGYATCVPAQDRNKEFLAQRLSGLASLGQMPPFTYEAVVARAKTVDVTWLNQRGLPAAFFEVEHTTDISTSLLKFLEFQDFRVKLYIVANRARQREFQAKTSYAAFEPIRNWVRFMDYDAVSQLHAKTTESLLINQQCDL